MSEFTSTQTVILVSILCRQMPELLKHILLYSTPPGKENTPSPIQLLSAQQIQEAQLHPSNIIKQILRATASIQGALNSSSAKIDNIGKQRRNIETTLEKLKEIDNKGKK